MSTIHTRHPNSNKQGVNISKHKYDVIREAIRESIGLADSMSLKELTQSVKVKVQDAFEGSIGWYVTVVKLDMESRGELLCDRSKSPHQHRLSG